jgi:hypothetical protein
MAPLLDLSSLSLDTVFTLGQTIEWLKGYRLGKYGFIGKDTGFFNSGLLGRDEVTNILSEVGPMGQGSRAAVEISRASTPIPLHVFYDSAAISDISDDELLSLYQFSTRFYEPEYIKDGNKYVTEKNWDNKPFVSVLVPRKTIFTADLRYAWRGTRTEDAAINPYDDVTSRDGGPSMPLANFAPASRENLLTRTVRTFMATPEVTSIQYKNILDSVSFIWQGPGSQPPLSDPGEFTIDDIVKRTEDRSSTRVDKETTDWNIGGKISIGFNTSDILKSVFGLPGLQERGNTENTASKDFSAEISGNYKDLAEKSSTNILSLKKMRHTLKSMSTNPIDWTPMSNGTKLRQ